MSALAQPAFAQVERPDLVQAGAGIRMAGPMRRETRETLMDLEKMFWAAVLEQARFFRSISGAFLEEAQRAFASGSEISAPPFADDVVFAHAARVAELLAATRILGRLRVRREAGLPLDRGSASLTTRRTLRFAEELSGVIPQRAVAYLRSLPVATRAEWERLIAAHRGAAFTAAGIEQKAALTALRDLIATSLESGLTPQQFDRAAREVLRNFTTSAGRLRTLWNTNVATAMARGRKEEMDDPAVRELLPWRLYDAILDARVRPNHAALDNGIAPWDWPGWARYEPPNGYNCRCVLLAIPAARARKMLADGSATDLTEGVPAGAGPDEGFFKAA